MVTNWDVGMLVSIPNDAGMILVCDTWRVVDVDFQGDRIKLQPLAHDGTDWSTPTWYRAEDLRKDMYVREEAPW